MRIAVGRDETTDVTESVIEVLRKLGHELWIADEGHWPEVATIVARRVATGDADQGVLFCWTGTGSAIAANKVPGIRAALVWEPWIAEGARLWNDANVLVMSSKRTTPVEARKIVRTWLSVAQPDPTERENIELLAQLERDARGDVDRVR